MGKLNIAHHKSYHPYRQDNIERVRRDEEEAAIKEAREEGRMALADAEARITLLRERAGVGTSAKERRREDEKRERELLRQATDADARADAASSSSAAGALGKGKHINLFEDLEENEITSAISRTRALHKVSKEKGKEIAETEKGIPLAPSAKDLKPWYSEKASAREEETDEEKRNRDLSHKSRSDPLTAIQRELASCYPTQADTSRSGSFSKRNREWGAPPTSQAVKAPDRSTALAPARAERESRESSERDRALALKARRRREAEGSATPSSVRGDDTFFYGDQFHARAVAEAHQWRGHGWNDNNRRHNRPRSHSMGPDRASGSVSRR